ncbi:MAG: hypothetical protein E3J35_01365 [Methanomassiliicoccales archaeon]|nr:MAG: hypothetical protein E3J35_01365 [Methanomassiliicoccales archaeon]
MRKFLAGNLLTITVVSLVLLMPISAILTLPHLSDSEDNIQTDSLCGRSKRFSSLSEMKEYIESSAERDYGRWEEGGWSLFPTLGGITATAPTTGGSFNDVSDYSTTNIQVEGVDEPDIVKTDGQYLYVKSGEEIVILRAYPGSEARVLSRIEVGQSAREMFLAGARLVVFDSSYYSDTTIKIYNVAQPSSPRLAQTVSISGRYLDSRLIDNYVYVVTTSYVYRSQAIELPTIVNDDNTKQVMPQEVCYFDEQAPSYSLTLIVSINVLTEDLLYKVYLTDSGQHVYASLENIYIAGTDYGPVALNMWGGGQFSQGTSIHKISIDEGKIDHVASGAVPGRVLNQFSMDEHEGYFRIATTSGSVWRGGGSSQNSVYVLDANMKMIGRLEGLAPGEQIYSARFMGDRCYLVTFKKIDPFFVIDLKNPFFPRVLGELKIPGYSDYLHPIDDRHVIGIGKDTHDMGDFAWFQGVKLSLFDVTFVSNPREISQYIIGHRGTDSYALRDHKAFMYSASNNLLIIPILLAEIDESDYQGEVPPNAYGDYTFQGAYVFSVTIQDGFQLRGRITHMEDGEDIGGRWGYYSSRSCVTRSLYIEDGIYTISEKMVKINDMDDLSEMKAIEL